MEYLLNFFVPEHYDLRLNINKHAGDFTGAVAITGQPRAETIKFHAENLSIDKIEIDGIVVDFSHEGDIVSVRLPKKVSNLIAKTADSSKQDAAEDVEATGKNSNHDAEASGKNPETLIVNIDFYGKLSHNMEGIYLSNYQYQGETKLVVATQFESHYARQCFPCIDEPAAKTTFDLTITVPDAEDVVLSNMPEKTAAEADTETAATETAARTSAKNSANAEADADHTKTAPETSAKSTTGVTHTFETTPRMSTYLLAFVIGEFHHQTTTNRHGVQVSTYAPLCYPARMLDFATQTAADALDYYNDLFKIPYPLKKLDQVALPDFEAGAMENWGLVTYRDVCLLVDDQSPLAARKSVSNVITHELSHQWFGDLVTMQWWDNLWLNESFANTMEYFATDHLYPDFHIWENFFTSDCQAAFRRDALQGVQAVQQEISDPAEISTLFDGAIVYAKGAHLMFMLIRTMGEENFFKGIHDYFEKHQYQNTTGDDLWAALQPYADFDVKEFMQTWISQPGYPVINMTKTPAATSSEDQKSATKTPTSESPAFRQQRFLLDGTTDDSRWPIPHLKDDMSGHYLINLSIELFNKKLNNFSQLSLEQKLRLLSDRVLLAKTDLVPSTSLIDLLNTPELAQETSAAVWQMIAGVTQGISSFFDQQNPDALADWRRYLGQFIQPQLKRLGISPRPDEPQDDTEVRSIILGLAYQARDHQTLTALANLADDDFSKIHPEIRDDVIASKFYLDDRAEKSGYFNFLLDQYQKVTDPELKSEILNTIRLAKYQPNVERVLQLLNQHEIVRPQDHLFLYIALRRNYYTKAAALNWVTTHWEYLIETMGDKHLDDYARYTAPTIRTEDEKTKFWDFFTPMQTQPNFRRTLEVARSEIDTTLHRLAAEQTEVWAKIHNCAKG